MSNDDVDFGNMSLSELSKIFDYEVDRESEKCRLIRKDSRIQIHIESIADDVSVVYLIVKLFSFDFSGDRTDLTDILSMLFAAFLRINNFFSVSLIDIDHPVLEETSCVYAKLLTINQPNGPIYRNELLHEKLFTIMGYIELFYIWMGPIQAELDHLNNSCFEKISFADWDLVTKEIASSHFGKSDEYNIIHRETPSWYYSNLYGEISIILCPYLAQKLKELYHGLYKEEFISGVDSNLHLSGNIKNAIPHEVISTAYSIVTEFEKKNDCDIQCIPIENSFLLITDNHIASFSCNCGLEQFKCERDKIEIRHKAENELLFPVNNFSWAESIKASEFEDLILELVNKENGVDWARKVGSTNSPDGGRDIICEWYIPKKQLDNDNELLFEKKTVIVQCKAYKKSVGKSDVTDIRDMLEHYNADGFLLATSSQLTPPLTDHLLSLKKNYWVDWWNRPELEDRVNKYQGLISSFPGVFTASRQKLSDN